MSHESLRGGPDSQDTLPALDQAFWDDIRVGLRASGGHINERDLAALRLRALGYTTVEVGAMIHYSTQYIKNSLTLAYKNLGVSDPFGAIAWCMEHGVITPEQIAPADYGARLALLIPREITLLDTAVNIQNANHRAIGSVLGRSEQSVKKSFARMHSRLNTRSTVQAAAIHMASPMLTRPNPAAAQL